MSGSPSSSTLPPTGSPNHDSIAAYLAQAATVRKIFHWIAVERLSIGEVVRRLDAEGIETATGKAHWDRSVVWGMLQNPAFYRGRAVFGKTQAREPLPRVRAPRHGAETPKKGYSAVRTEPTAWIEIPVPALVSEQLFLAVQEQLDENRKHARQRRRGAAYLLQGLTVCGHCHYAYYGKKVSKAAAKAHQHYAYYPTASECGWLVQSNNNQSVMRRAGNNCITVLTQASA
jgi:site-specific DNA recombinase